ncbi:hypothetical protein HK102_001881 [Quaeritorhiza haematococci]|nr:hypothetical protein HK102_001881 [Quaeritorhiza haematococci]
MAAGIPSTDIHQLITRGAPVEDIAAFISSNPHYSLNTQDSSGRTSLSVATVLNKPEICEVLLLNGADPNTCNKDNTTPLINAAIFGYNDILRILLFGKRSGKSAATAADVGAHNQGFRALCEAVTRDHLDSVRLLVTDAGIHPDFSRGPDEKQTPLPLCLAVTYGRTDIFKFLLENGSPEAVNQKNSDGATALEIAGIWDRADIAGLILSSSALDVNANDNQGFRALLNAISRRHTSVVKVLLNSGKVNCNAFNAERDSVPICQAAISNSPEIIELLVQHGADVNTMAKQHQNATALILAAQWGHLEVVKNLLKQGVDLTGSQRQGFRALIEAVIRGHHVVVQELAKAGVNQDMFDPSSDESPPTVVAATYNSDAKIISVLHQNGFDVDAAGRNDITALIAAATWNKEPIIDFLLDGGKRKVDPGRHKQGLRALQSASERNYPHIIRKLLDIGGISPDSSDPGMAIPPIITAATRGYLEAVTALVEGGANALAKDRDSNTALSVAASWGHFAIVSFLLHSTNSWTDKSVLEHALAQAKSRNHQKICELLEEAIQKLDDLSHLGVFGLIRLGPGSFDTKLALYVDQHPKCVYERDSERDRTPLIEAVVESNFDAVELLLQRGSRVNAVDDLRYTALGYAVEKGSLKILEALLKSGADPNMLQGTSMRSPLILAMLRLDAKMIYAVVEVLLTGGANPNLRDVSDQTPLMYAVSVSSPSTASGSSKTAPTSSASQSTVSTTSASTPTAPSSPLISLLLSKGANPQARDIHTNDTAVLVAAGTGNTAAVEQLLKAGAVVTSEDKKKLSLFGSVWRFLMSRFGFAG